MKGARAGALALVLCLLGAGTGRAAERSVTLGGMAVTVWSRPMAAGVTQPVVIFSHGFHGCSTQSRFLMEALASDGYLVFAPNHRDATCGGARWRDRPEVPFGRPERWDDSTYRDRQEDIGRLVDAIKADARFNPRVNWSRFALAGHSLGGYTVLGLGGAWPSWDLAGVKAVLALSPYSQPFVVHETLGGLATPVMYQGGTLDFGITPAVRRPRGAYDQSPASKYFVEFTGAGHLAWTNVGRAASRDGIVAYSLAFLNHYVKGEPAAPVLTQARPGVALYRYASELGQSGVGGEAGR